MWWWSVGSRWRMSGDSTRTSGYTGRSWSETGCYSRDRLIQYSRNLMLSHFSVGQIATLQQVFFCRHIHLTKLFFIKLTSRIYCIMDNTFTYYNNSSIFRSRTHSGQCVESHESWGFKLGSHYWSYKYARICILSCHWDLLWRSTIFLFTMFHRDTLSYIYFISHNYFSGLWLFQGTKVQLIGNKN